MQAVASVSSAERIFREDVVGAQFCAGQDRGYWRLVAIDWPFATFEVAAAPRPGAPDGYGFRFDLSGYPQAPTARLWDLDRNAELPVERWPTGDVRVAGAFNPGWRPDAIYVPADRVALEGHDAWHTKHACFVWDPDRDITQYLRLLHDLVNEEGYTGVRGA